MAVARAINGNANVGVTCTQWSGELTDVLIDKLKRLGYTIENKKDAYSKDITYGSKNAFAFDYWAACCGFLYTFDTAASMIQSGRYKKIIVIGADKMSSVVDYKDRATCPLFGDGAAAVLLEATTEPTSITDAYALLKALNRRAGFSRERTSIKMISNRVSSEAEGKNLFEKMSIVVDKFLNIQPELLGMIPQDDQMSKAVMLQKPITVAYPNSAAAKALETIAHKLCNEQEPETKKGITGLFSDLIRTRFKKARSKKEGD